MVVLRVLFGARAQIVVGSLFVVATAFQAVWWGFVTRPTIDALFWLSIEALFFAAYAVVATGLGFRATERVEAHVEAQAVDGAASREATVSS